MVTGGGNGIGKSSCEVLTASGANVVVSDLKPEDARKFTDEINGKGGKAAAVGEITGLAVKWQYKVGTVQVSDIWGVIPVELIAVIVAEQYGYFSCFLIV